MEIQKQGATWLDNIPTSSQILVGYIQQIAENCWSCRNFKYRTEEAKKWHLGVLDRCSSLWVLPLNGKCYHILSVGDSWVPIDEWKQNVLQEGLYPIQKSHVIQEWQWGQRKFRLLEIMRDI